MADAYLGNAADFKIGASAGSLTAISGAGNGLSEVELTDEVGTRVIPGGGDAVRRQSLVVHDNGISFSVDANSVTWPLLHRKSGATVYFEYGPRGTGSGMPRYTGSFIAQVSEASPSDDVIRFTVTGEINGPVTAGTY